MKLSTKGRYGTRLMLNLALHYNEGKEAVVLKNISKEEDLSIRYLEQIIIPLKINRLVKSVRGAGGGYTLAKQPSEITLCEIVEVLEGACALVDCVEDPGSCERMTECATYEIWKEASEMLQNYFESKTLQDLIEIAKKKKQK
ncbi:MAG: Rrf2 family transcriptional regulator [Candidatus Aminicenantes bacterium]|nr:MAG: Rrf2 family transcriptional regulator [Candidatus Aminicenantes bacterium]